mmetsp:Transcript_32478/g.42929  ORF Transcript_32478/g.42929 Transcript_32478/m.42929 type:complete len:115 (+) Transcript_32478:424-768(+)
MLSFICQGYQSFKFDNSLIGRVYPTGPHGPSDDGEEGGPSEARAKRSLMRALAERGKYFYSYWEYTLASALAFFCIIFVRDRPWFQKRYQKLKRHEKARRKLANEVDILQLVKI